MKKILLLAALSALALAACTKTVVEGPLPDVLAEAITLDKEDLIVPLDEKMTLHVTVTPEDAGPIAWISDDPSVASVSQDGVVTGNSLGEAEIFAASGKFLASCHVTVVRPITGITLNKMSVKITRKETLQLIATITPDDATESIEWLSEDPEIATVDEDGLVTAENVGKVVITAKTIKTEAKCEVEVIPLEVEKVSISPESAKDIAVGETISFTAEISPEDADDLTIVWSIEDEAIASIDEDGLLTAIAPGTTYIKATASNGVYGEAFVHVAGARSVPYFEDFNDINEVFAWMTSDRDGDGEDWYIFDDPVHSGPYSVGSYSYHSTARTPDNWLFSPMIKLDASYNRLSFWVSPYSTYWPLETYAAYLVFPNENGEITDEELDNAFGLVKGTLTQGYEILYETTPSEGTSSNQMQDDGWEHVVVDIPSEHNGKEVFIAIRHFDCTDQYAFILDDIEVTNVPEETVTETASIAPRFIKDRSQSPSLRPFFGKIVK